VLLLALTALVPGAFAGGPRGDSFTVTHGPVVITLADPDSDGHQLGDLRVTSLPVSSEDGDPIGRLDSTLTTVGIDVPNDGDEVRISVLVFSFQDPADQLVIQGTAFYPRAGGTLATDTTVERPITGGSGRFAGAGGHAESEHLADGTWRHTFHLTGIRRGGMPHRPSGEGHEGMDPAASAPPTGIVRTLLGTVEPTTAEGETLSLWEYTIPAGAALTPHTHPGFQVAHIDSGTLTYEVLSGEVTIQRGDGSTETATAGDEVLLAPGDTVIESPGMAHFGANNGSEPVVLHAASLFTTGSEPALPLPSTAP
jgi:quercetin dioxygenase-like cupin family protein